MKRRDFFAMGRREFFGCSLALSALTLGRGKASTARPPEAPAPESEFPSAPDLTQQVAEFIVRTQYSDLPAGVLALGKKSILDSLGLALAGSASVMAPLVHQYLRSLGLSGGPSGGSTSGAASIIGTDIKVPPRFAAFANGIAIHGDDYDDTQLSEAADRIYGLLCHPSVTTLSPALAICEAGKRSGRELLVAYHVGAEVECKIAEAISPRHYDDGFHSTGTCGSFGSAATCARLRGLNVQQTAYALGIAAAEGSGFRDNFGTMAKPFQAGNAAQNGTVAADLAALGWTAAPDILEAPRGFFQAAGGGFDPHVIVGRLGNPWTFASPGVSIKPYPSGSLTHPAMGELERIMRESGIKAADVEKVDIGGNHAMITSIFQHHPSTGLEAKFSMEYCLSVLLVEGRAGLVQFTDAAVQSPAVQAMIPKINFYLDPEAEAAGLDKMTSILKIHLKDGRVLGGRAEFAKGSPANPMSYDEVAEKFRGCAEFVNWPEQKRENVIDQVLTLENLADVSKLTASLV